MKYEYMLKTGDGEIFFNCAKVDEITNRLLLFNEYPMGFMLTGMIDLRKNKIKYRQKFKVSTNMTRIIFDLIPERK